MITRKQLTVAVMALSFSAVSPASLYAEEVIEKAGIATGVSVGNIFFLPIKVISVSMGAITGALSYVVTGGNADLTQQIWRDTQQGPYVITPELAHKSVGQRPEIAGKK